MSEQDQINFERFKKIIQVLRSWANRRELHQFTMSEIEEIMGKEDPDKTLRSLEWFQILLQKIYGRDESRFFQEQLSKTGMTDIICPKCLHIIWAHHEDGCDYYDRDNPKCDCESWDIFNIDI